MYEWLRELNKERGDLMAKHNDKYPNKADFEPNRDLHLKDGGEELPLSDPSESDSTEVFRENETNDKGEHKPSAFSENKSK